MRRAALVLLAVALVVAALSVVGLLAEAKDSEIVFPMGIVAFPVMFYSALVEWAGAAGKRWPFHPLLRDFNSVGVVLFWWQAGLLVARLHGNTADVPRTIEGILFATVFAATVGLAYRSLDRSRLELIEAGEHESRAS